MFLLKSVECDAFFMAKMLFKKTRSQIQPSISESNLLTSEFEHVCEFVGRHFHFLFFYWYKWELFAVLPIHASQIHFLM